MVARLRLGELLVHSGQAFHDEAETVLTEARGQATSPAETAETIHLLALLARARGLPAKALELLEQSPAAGASAITGDARGQWFHFRALVAADRGEVVDAERLLLQALETYRQTRNEASVAAVCDSIANLLLRRGKSHPALAFARLSLERKRELGDRFGEAISLGTLGRIYQRQARYAEAAEAFTADLAIARELGDERGIGIMLNSLGELALETDLAAAEAYYRGSLEVDRGPVNAAYGHLGLARAALAGNRLDEAATACDQAEAILGAHLVAPGPADILTGLRGALAWRRGDIPLGESLLAKAVAALERSYHAMDTVPFLYELRDLYTRRGDLAEAVRVMTRALDLLADSGAARGVDDAEEWLREVDAPVLTRLALCRHFPGHIVGEILTGRVRKPPARQQEIAVLFCDLRDYTTLAEGLPPEQVVELLNEWFSEVTAAVLAHDGVVDKFIGDAVMAVFGAAEPRPDAAACAVQTALALREALWSRNLRHRAIGGKTLRIGIGIDAGMAVVGFIGSHRQQSYAAIGDATNTAARLQSATKDYPGCEILISGRVEAVQARLGVAETVPLGARQLKGKTTPVEVYQVLGPRHPPTAPDSHTESPR
jgi:class 3 adenylate cyclase